MTMWYFKSRQIKDILSKMVNFITLHLSRDQSFQRIRNGVQRSSCIGSRCLERDRYWRFVVSSMIIIIISKTSPYYTVCPKSRQIKLVSIYYPKTQKMENHSYQVILPKKIWYVILWDEKVSELNNYSFLNERSYEGFRGIL
jgi:hypothetical protein